MRICKLQLSRPGLKTVYQAVRSGVFLKTFIRRLLLQLLPSSRSSAVSKLVTSLTAKEAGEPLHKSSQPSEYRVTRVILDGALDHLLCGTGIPTAKIHRPNMMTSNPAPCLSYCVGRRGSFSNS